MTVRPTHWPTVCRADFLLVGPILSEEKRALGGAQTHCDVVVCNKRLGGAGALTQTPRKMGHGATCMAPLEVRKTWRDVHCT